MNNNSNHGCFVEDHNNKSVDVFFVMVTKTYLERDQLILTPFGEKIFCLEANNCTHSLTFV